MTRQEAMVSGSTRYFGGLCAKHPELNGERRTCNCCCIACIREIVKARSRKGGVDYEHKLKRQNARKRKGGPDHPYVMAHNTARRIHKKRAAFVGYEAEIRAVYAACPSGHDVDHITPLVGIDRITRCHVVCGLHVPWNLRYLLATDNRNKKWAWFDDFKGENDGV